MIPDFLKLENVPQKESEMKLALDRYISHFGEGVNTEPSSWSEKEWVDILNECVKRDKTLEKLLGTEYDSEADY